MSVELTKKEIIREIIKCGKDPVYFITNFVKISHPVHGLLSFKLYPFQIQCINDFQHYRHNVILKSRQLGLSTTTAAYILWLMLFHRDKAVLTVATKLNVAAGMVKKVKNMYKELPTFFKDLATIIGDNKNTFEFDNGSGIIASSTTSNAGRSDALSLLVVDEAAMIEGMDEMWSGIGPTISTGGRCIAISTPKGVGNWFHKIYSGAEMGTNLFHPIKLNWDVHPDRDQEWFDNETKNYSARYIAQEYCCSFNLSGNTLIDGEVIEDLMKLALKPLEREEIDRNLWIWKRAEQGRRYALIADVARGDAEDYSAFHIFDIDNCEQVAEYQGKINPEAYADLIYRVSQDYGFCLTVVENNTYGFGVLERLKSLGHPSIYYHKKTTNDFIEPAYAESDPTAVLGFNTSPKMRPLIIAKLEEFLRNKIIKINSERLVNELKTFIWNNGRAEAIKGANDDLVMSCAIFCWIHEGSLIISQRDVEYRKTMLLAISTGNRKFESTIPGMPNHNKSSEVRRRWMDSYAQAKEFSWLLR